MWARERMPTIKVYCRTTHVRYTNSVCQTSTPLLLKGHTPKLRPFPSEVVLSFEFRVRVVGFGFETLSFQVLGSASSRMALHQVRQRALAQFRVYKAKFRNRVSRRDLEIKAGFPMMNSFRNMCVLIRLVAHLGVPPHFQPSCAIAATKTRHSGPPRCELPGGFGAAVTGAGPQNAASRIDLQSRQKPLQKSDTAVRLAVIRQVVYLPGGSVLP